MRGRITGEEDKVVLRNVATILKCIIYNDFKQMEVNIRIMFQKVSSGS